MGPYDTCHLPLGLKGMYIACASAAAAAAPAGATIQVLLFAVMAVEIKRKAPTCHTVLEVVNVRSNNYELDC